VFPCDSVTEILTCTGCGSSRKLSASVLAGWGIHVDPECVADVRTALSEHHEKIVCSACGARRPRIGTQAAKSAHNRPPGIDIGLEKLLSKHGNWLRGGEARLLYSFLKQVRSGRSLSSRQIQVMSRIEEQAAARRGAKFIEGGGPGTGRRR